MSSLPSSNKLDASSHCTMCGNGIVPAQSFTQRSYVFCNEKCLKKFQTDMLPGIVLKEEQTKKSQTNVPNFSSGGVH